jgi:hypothetical protein
MGRSANGQGLPRHVAGMTPMSRSQRSRRTAAGRKLVSRLESAPVARVLLRLRKRMSSALLVGALAGQPGSGCVLPPDLEPAGADAGPSSPPVIQSASPPEVFAFPGPIVIDRLASPVMVLVATDNDVGDSLFVRLYRDYNRPPELRPQPPLADCQTPPTGTFERIINCPTNALCNQLAPDDTENHVLEAMIADREFILDGDPEAQDQPQFRAVADPTRAAWSMSSWVMRCQPVQ